MSTDAAAMHRAIDAWVDAHFDEEVRFLQELVRVPTDTPPGDNARHAERTAVLLHELGFDPEMHRVPDDAVRAQGMRSITNDDADLCVRAFARLLDDLAQETR